MSDRTSLDPDLVLSEDLAAIETRMRQVVPQASQLNRDELMYRAGWAAARAGGDASQSSLRLWQAAAGVLAASLLMAVTKLVSDDPAAVSSVPVAEASSNAEPKKVTNDTEHPVVALSYTTSIRSTAPLLMMRDRALNQDFSELPISSSASAIASPALTTNQKLIEELLPRKGTSIDPWPRFLLWNLGESS